MQIFFNYSLANSLGLFTVPLKQPLNATALDGRLLCTVTRKNKDLEGGTALFGISESHFLVQDIVVGGVRPQYPSQHLYRNVTLQVCPWVPFPFVSCSRTGDPRTLCLGHGQSLLSHVDASSPDAATQVCCLQERGRQEEETCSNPYGWSTRDLTPHME